MLPFLYGILLPLENDDYKGGYQSAIIGLKPALIEDLRYTKLSQLFAYIAGSNLQKNKNNCSIRQYDDGGI